MSEDYRIGFPLRYKTITHEGVESPLLIYLCPSVRVVGLRCKFCYRIKFSS